MTGIAILGIQLSGCPLHSIGGLMERLGPLGRLFKPSQVLFPLRACVSLAQVPLSGGDGAVHRPAGAAGEAPASLAGAAGDAERPRQGRGGPARQCERS